MAPMSPELGLSRRRRANWTATSAAACSTFSCAGSTLEALHACLDLLIRDQPDARLAAGFARAGLSGAEPARRCAGRDAAAARRQDFGSPPRSLLARIYLAQGDLDAAHQVAQSLVQEQPASVTAWELLAEVELARGDTGRGVGRLPPRERDSTRRAAPTSWAWSPSTRRAAIG